MFGEMIQFDEHIFQMGWFNHQLVLVCIGWFLFLQKFYWDKLQLKVSLGLMISMGTFAFGAVGLGLKFLFGENGGGFSNFDGSFFPKGVG